MPFDGLTLHCILSELALFVEGGKVEQVYQPSRLGLSLVLYSRALPGKTACLFISADPACPGLALAATEGGNPASPPAFCRVLRKHLSGARIEKIAAVAPWERTVSVKFTSGVVMYVELTGRHSNVVLVGSEGNVIDALRKNPRGGAAVQALLPGKPYSPPPAPGKLDPLDARAEDVREFVSRARNPVSALVDGYMGVSPATAREVLVRSGELPEACAAELRSLARGALTFHPGDSSPTLVVDSSARPVDFTFFPYASHSDLDQVPMKTVNGAAAEYLKAVISRHVENELRQRLERNLKRALGKSARKLRAQSEDYGDASRAGFYRQAGEALLSYAHEVRKGMTEANLPNPYAPSDDEAPRTIRVALDPKLDASGNAKSYFRKYRKCKKALMVLSGWLERTKAEVESLEKTLREVQRADSLERLREIEASLDPGAPTNKGSNRGGERSKGGGPLRFTSSDGLTIIVGRSQAENERVTFGIAGPSDVWLHAKGVPGAHVILKVRKGKSVPQRSLAEAARLAAFFSRKRGESSVTVDYAKRSNVWKVKGAAPGVVLYRDFHSIVVRPEGPPGAT